MLIRNVGILGALAMLALFALAACGNDDDQDDAAATDDATELASGDSATLDDDTETTGDATNDPDDTVADEPVAEPDEQDDVTPPDDFEGQVIEVTITDHDIEMNVDQVEAGEIYFIGTNEGSSTHALATRFPVQENPSIERVLEPGESGVIHTFSEDPFFLYCSIDDHAEEHGMEIEIDPVE